MCAHLYTIRRAREKRIKSIFVSIYTYFHATLSRATLKVCQHIVVVVNKKSILDTHVLKTTKSFKMVRTDVCICTWILSDRFFTLFLYVWWVDGLDDIWITFNETNLTNPSKTSSKTNEFHQSSHRRKPRHQGRSRPSHSVLKSQKANSFSVSHTSTPRSMTPSFM